MRNHLYLLIFLTFIVSCGSSGKGSGNEGADTDTNTEYSTDTETSSDDGPSGPLNVPLVVRETLGIDRVGEMVHNGVPISRVEELFSTEELVIEDSDDNVIPATFEVLSRWQGGHNDETSEIQWLLISFPVSMDAGDEETF